MTSTSVHRPEASASSGREDALWLRSILDSVAEAVVVADANGHLVEFNPAAERLHGVSLRDEPPEGWGRTYGIFLPDESTPCPSDQIPLVRASRGEFVDHIELYLRRPDGTGSHVEVTGRPIRGSDGSLAGGVVVFSDTTERRDVDRELRASSAYARGLIEASLDPLVTISPTGQITDVNRATEEVTGAPREELVGSDFANYFTEPDRARAGYRRVLAEGSVRDYPLTILRKDGKRTDVLYHATIYRNERGELQGVFAAARDITELKRAEAALRRDEEALNEAQRLARLGSWEWDAITDKICWSDEYYRVSGIPLGTPPPGYEEHLNIYTAESAERLDAAVQHSMASGDPYELDLEQKERDGGRRWITARGECRFGADGKVCGLRGTAQDITERKLAERTIAEQARTLDLFFKHTPTSLVLLDRWFNFVQVNDAYAKACQRDAAGLKGRNHFELYPSVELQREFQRVVATKEPYRAVARPFVFPDHPELGETYWDLSLEPVLDVKGEVDLLVFSLDDVTARRRADEEVRAASLYARRLIEASLDPLVTISPAGKITDVNRATEEATGIGRDTLVGTDFADYFTEPERARSGYQLVLANGSVRDYALTLRHSSGRTIAVLYNATVYRDGAGAVQGVFAAARDVTELRRAEAARALLAAIVDSSSDAIIGRDLAGVITSWNAGAERLYGYTPAEAIGRPGGMLAPPELQDEGRAMVDRVLKGEVLLQQDTVRVRKDGSRVDISLTLSPIRDGSGAIVGISTISRDITARKRGEEEIRRLNRDLERKVAERTAELAASNRELEAFSYSVSHDLRAPLRSIHGFSQALLEDDFERLDELGRGHLRRICASVERMGTLIDDILSLSRVSRGDMEWGEVDMGALAREVGSELCGAYPGRDVTLTVQDHVVAHGDRKLLRVALTNLLDNGWKFTSRHPVAHVEFGRVEHGSEVAFFVKDDGAGFDMAYADRLFTPFQRLHSTEEFPGTGIGLATVQRIIRRHGGRMWAEAAVEQGATFFFTLEGAPPS